MLILQLGDKADSLLVFSETTRVQVQIFHSIPHFSGIGVRHQQEISCFFFIVFLGTLFPSHKKIKYSRHTHNYHDKKKKIHINIKLGPGINVKAAKSYYYLVLEKIVNDEIPRGVKRLLDATTRISIQAEEAADYLKVLIAKHS